jgi:hypothetical protein
MTALPVLNATAATPIAAAPDAPSSRSRAREDRSDLPPAWAQLAAAIVATSLIWLAFDIALAGWVWAGLPLVVLAAAIFLGAVLPDLIAARWDRS